MGTRIIETVALGTRPGTRRELNSTVVSARYRLYDGNMDYLRSETRHHGHLHEDVVPTIITKVLVARDGHMEFDTGVLAPRPGEAVHVMEHRILGRRVYDLYKDGTRNLITEGADPFARSLSPFWTYAAGAIGTIASMTMENDALVALLHGAATALVVHGLRHAHLVYGRNALRALRALGVRRIGRALDARD
jgi:hypothetical protein